MGELERARAAAAAVVDPELPMLTLEDLGVLRSVALHDGRVVVRLTPTYTGCPAFATMRADLRLALAAAGFRDVEVLVELSPPWSPDDITERGRRRLREHGIAPPGAAPATVDLLLLPTPEPPRCPRCAADRTREVSRFGPSPCLSVHACVACGEPFEQVRAL